MPVHDTYFISHIANRILYLNHGEEPQFFEGDWDYFSYKLNEKEMYEETQPVEEKKEEKESVLSYKEANRLRNRVISLERQCKDKQDEVTLLEGKIKELEAEMEKPAVYSDIKRVTQVMRDKQQAEGQKTAVEDAWFALSSELDQLKAETGK